MRITAKKLQGKGACSDQVEVFAAEWPDGVEVTEEALLRAADLGLGLTWFAKHFLPRLFLAEYRRQKDRHWDEYKRQVNTFLREYERLKVTLLAEYERQKARLICRLLSAQSQKE